MQRFDDVVEEKHIDLKFNIYIYNNGGGFSTLSRTHIMVEL